MASFADLLLTCDVPAVDLSGTLRDGTDDARGQKAPLPAQPWRRCRCHKASSATAEPPVQAVRWHGNAEP